MTFFGKLNTKSNSCSIVSKKKKVAHKINFIDSKPGKEVYSPLIYNTFLNVPKLSD